METKKSCRQHALIATIVVLALIIGGYFYFSHPNRAIAPATGNATTTPAAPESSTLSLTQDYNDKSVTLHTGDRFLLDLGDLNWTISISDPSVISRVKNIMVIRGAQGIYTADRSGTTVISAEGRPNCNPGEMCAQYIVSFKANIIVE